MIGKMRSMFLVGWSLYVVFLISCGPPTECNVGDTQACQCGPLQGTQTCQANGLFAACQCDSKVRTNLPPEAIPAEGTPSTELPIVQPEGGPTEPTPIESILPEPTPEQVIPEVTCPSGRFAWLGRCYDTGAFCTSTTGDSAMPLFSAKEQLAMARPFVIEFDPTTKKPLFCQTRQGFFYLKNLGYGICDNDGDGWINIFANQAFTSTDPLIQRNARCALRRIEAIVYVQDAQKFPEVPNQKTFIQPLNPPVSLVETDRNDGLNEQIKLPVYTENQVPLPKNIGTFCTQDSNCDTNTKEVCYLGHCVSGRRFRPEEINTFTKACVAGLDLNDNQLDDASETPNSQPSPSTEFAPLLKLAYFIELHYGDYLPNYVTPDGQTLNVWRITERGRTGPADNPSFLPLKCPENPDAFQPDHWRSCGLRDNQQCEDPANPGTKKNGLSQCWMPQVRRATPSLFRCVTFDSTVNASTQDGFFHPQNYGKNKNYTRSLCKLVGDWKHPDPTNPHQKDLVFSCAADDGTLAPDPAKSTVGWACINFQPYTAPQDYLGGCIDEKAHEVCGTPGGVDNLTYLQHEADSYGLVRAKKECGSKGGLGVCKSAEHVCSGGNWTHCGLCNTCPQDTAGQKRLCPDGVWGDATPPDQSPIISCKPVVQASAEICDGQDNDCDGKLDEGLPQVLFYPDKDGDKFGDAKHPGQLNCRGQQPAGWVEDKSDCDDNNKDINPSATEVCDGQDNDCNGSRDLNIEPWYADNDKDGFGKKGPPAFEGCQRPDGRVCVSPGVCRDTVGYVKDGSDCCDSDPNTFPGQTAYTDAPNACGNFDLNCDGKETPQADVCACSKQSVWVFDPQGANTTTRAGTWYYSNDPNAKKGPDVVYINNSVFNNPSSCELSGAMTFLSSYINVANLYPLQFGSCPANGGGTCSFREEMSYYSGQGASWTTFPKGSTGAPLIMWKDTGYRAGCLFHKDGRTPQCGEAGAFRAPAVRTITSIPIDLKGALVKNISQCQQHTACQGIQMILDVKGPLYPWYAIFTEQPTQTAPAVKCQ
ncbi:MAG: putative metal-binding motif-containing protein [Myxococcales bacterium]|nr:putative metal-binding motif-containing protein [Myxococcales bacterium]